jgi:hypothetical protein
MFVLGVTATAAAMALSFTKQSLDDHRALGAARFVAGRLQQARAEAVARGANVALRFSGSELSIRFTAYADGNYDGVSARDILAGVDTEVASPVGLTGFGDIGFALQPDVPDADETPLSDTDPIRFGSARMASFTARGTATPGSLYIAGPKSRQYVVRVFGDTGKTHILRYDRQRRRWQAL